MNKLVPIGPSATTAVIAALVVGFRGTRQVLLAGAVVMLLVGASYGRGAPAAEAFSLSPSVIQINPKRPNIVYASALGDDTHEGGVFKSIDGGQTWSAANRGLKAPPGSPNWTLPGVPLYSVRVDALTLDPRSPNVLYAGTGLGVFKTTDGAKTWKLASDGIVLRTGNRHLLYEGAIYALGIDPSHTSTVYAAGMGGVWKTTTGGATWTHVLRNRALNLAIDPRQSEIVYASMGFPNVATRTSIFKTVDGGGTWRAIGPSGLHVPIVVDRHRAGMIYAGGSRGLFASRNKGRTWSRLPSPGSAAARVDAIALDPMRANVLYVGGWASGVVKSNDGGQTWSKLRLGIRSVSTIAIAPTRPQTVYAGGEGIWKSTDSGATWHRLTR